MAEVPIQLVSDVFECPLKPADFFHQAAGEVVGEKIVRMVMHILKAGVDDIGHDPRLEKIIGKIGQAPKTPAQAPYGQNLENNRQQFAYRPVLDQGIEQLLV